jgi:hypothetical protein
MFATLLVGLVMSVSSVGVQPPTQPGSATSSAELADRVKSMELQVKTLEEKYAQGVALQAEYRGFYEKAFNTQTNIVWAVGILLTTMLAVAGLLGFRAFERQTEAVIKGVVTEFRVSMEERLRAETEALAEKNQKQVSDAIDRLAKTFQDTVAEIKVESQATHLFESGTTFVALKQYGDAVSNFRRCLEQYTKQTNVRVIQKTSCVSTIRNLFVALRLQAPDKFGEAAKKELSRELYGQLREEVILAAHESKALSEVLSEIGWKLVPDKPADQDSPEEKPGEKTQA